MATHLCPGGCGQTNVRSDRFACRACWYRLPADLRSAIWSGYRARAGSDQHRAAMADAVEWYRANPRPSGGA